MVNDKCVLHHMHLIVMFNLLKMFNMHFFPFFLATDAFQKFFPVISFKTFMFGTFVIH